MLGLTALKEEKIYNEKGKYKEWRAGFDHLLDEFNGNYNNYDDDEYKNWNISLEYIKKIINDYGPFDGIAGFCEGSAVASVLLNLQKNGYDYGLGNVKFFIALSPWQSPLHKKDELYSIGKPLDIPTLMVVGKNDMDVFLHSAQKFQNYILNVEEFYHNGEHVYPLFSEKLKEKLDKVIYSEEFEGE